MTNKKLTPQEILRALADGKIILCDHYLYKMSDTKLMTVHENRDLFREATTDITWLFNFDCTIYTPPEPKKKLSERFALDFGNNGGLITTVANVYNWLKENEDE